MINRQSLSGYEYLLQCLPINRINIAEQNEAFAFFNNTIYLHASCFKNPQTLAFYLRLGLDAESLIKYQFSDFILDYVAINLWASFTEPHRNEINLLPKQFEVIDACIKANGLIIGAEVWQWLECYHRNKPDIVSPELLTILQPIEHVLASGGDDRTCLNIKTQQGKYGTTMYPRENIVCLSSCTASSIEEVDYIRAFMWRQNILTQISDPSFDPREQITNKMEAVRKDLLRALHLDEIMDLVYTPSGTDAEYLPLYLLQATHPAHTIKNILVSPSEIGSGSLLASHGRYFGKLTPDQTLVDKGARVTENMNLQVDYLILRAENACLKSESALYVEYLERINNYDKADVLILLHLIDCAKSGIGGPTVKAIKMLKDSIKFASVKIIIDAAQGRVSLPTIQHYAEISDFIIITGSKFIGNVPFSGAVLVSKHISNAIQCIPKPFNLIHFYQQWCFPSTIDQIAAPFHKHINIGLSLRWILCSETFIEFYNLDSQEIRNRVAVLNELIRNCIEKTPCLKLVMEPVLDRNNQVPFWDESATILNFAIIDQSSNKCLDFNSLEEIYRKLQSDHCVYIGQPVLLGDELAVLRIAISARDILDFTKYQDRFKCNLEIARVALINCIKDYLHWSDNFG